VPMQLMVWAQWGWGGGLRQAAANFSEAVDRSFAQKEGPSQEIRN
jgi:hypothetical protein